MVLTYVHTHTSVYHWHPPARNTARGRSAAKVENLMTGLLWSERYRFYVSRRFPSMSLFFLLDLFTVCIPNCDAVFSTGAHPTDLVTLVERPHLSPYLVGKDRRPLDALNSAIMRIGAIFART